MDIDLFVKNFDEYLDEEIKAGKDYEALNLLNKVKDICQKYESRMKNIVVRRGDGVFFVNDRTFDEKHLKEVLNQIFENIKTSCGKYIINEIAILKLVGEKIHPVYFFTLDVEKIKIAKESDRELFDLQNVLLMDLDYLKRNVLDYGNGLSDGEGAIALKQVGGSFDIIIRKGDYIFGFNNSDESIENLRIMYGFDQNVLLKQVSNLEGIFKKQELEEESD